MIDIEKGTNIICIDCGEEFVFTEGEQKFYEMKNLTPPKRCKNCRAKRKAEREEKRGY